MSLARYAVKQKKAILANLIKFQTFLMKLISSNPIVGYDQSRCASELTVKPKKNGILITKHSKSKPKVNTKQANTIDITKPIINIRCKLFASMLVQDTFAQRQIGQLQFASSNYASCSFSIFSIFF